MVETLNFILLGDISHYSCEFAEKVSQRLKDVPFLTRADYLQAFVALMQEEWTEHFRRN